MDSYPLSLPIITLQQPDGRLPHPSSHKLHPERINSSPPLTNPSPQTRAIRRYLSRENVNTNMAPPVDFPDNATLHRSGFVTSAASHASNHLGRSASTNAIPPNDLYEPVSHRRRLSTTAVSEVDATFALDSRTAVAKDWANDLARSASSLGVVREVQDTSESIAPRAAHEEPTSVDSSNTIDDDDDDDNNLDGIAVRRKDLKKLTGEDKEKRNSNERWRAAPKPKKGFAGVVGFAEIALRRAFKKKSEHVKPAHISAPTATWTPTTTPVSTPTSTATPPPRPVRPPRPRAHTIALLTDAGLIGGEMPPSAKYRGEEADDITGLGYSCMINPFRMHPVSAGLAEEGKTMCAPSLTKGGW